MQYYRSRTVAGEFDDVVAAVEEALADEGFGVLSDIDVRAAFEAKLGLEDYPRYRILGACNPPLAHEGLDHEVNLGVLLPCNVVVYETDADEVVVSAVDPEAMLSVVGSPALDDIATEVGERFDRVFESLAAAPSQ
jgi:uncharacterized protein (DUF302 family)